MRPTIPAAYWKDHPRVFAGRDLEKGGTWLGVATTGRFAALTNFRDPASRKPDPRSRGGLVSGFLTGDADAASYLAEVGRHVREYDDFNLVVGDRHRLHYLSSRDGGARELPAGVYGVSNYFLDTPWPKLMQAKATFQEIIDAPGLLIPRLFELLSDASPAPDDQLPDTGVGLDWERKLSPIFIASPGYGTRASTVVLFDRNGGIRFWEKSFGEDGEFSGQVDETIMPGGTGREQSA